MHFVHLQKSFKKLTILYNPGQKSYAYIEFSKMLYPVGDGPYRIRFWSHEIDENMPNSPLRQVSFASYYSRGHRTCGFLELNSQTLAIRHCSLLFHNGLWGCEFPEPKSSVRLSDIAYLLLYSSHWNLEFPELNNQPLAIRHCSFAS